MKYSWLAVFLGVLSLPLLTLAQEYQAIVGIPGIEGNGDLSQYMNAVYRLAITIAALLAVLIIIKGGVKYMFSDIVTDKSSAKSDIRGAILGLLLILSGVLILSTVNEDLTDFQILITPIEPPPAIDDGGGTQPPTIDELCNDAGQCAAISCSDNFFTGTNCQRDCTAAGGVISNTTYNPDTRSYDGPSCTFNKNTCNQDNSRFCCEANNGSSWTFNALDAVAVFNICENEGEELDLMNCYNTGNGFDCQQATQECESVQFGNVVATNEGGSRILCDTTPLAVAENLQEFADNSCPDEAVSCRGRLDLSESECESRNGVYYTNNGEACVVPTNLTPAPADDEEIINQISSILSGQNIIASQVSGDTLMEEIRRLVEEGLTIISAYDVSYETEYAPTNLQTIREVMRQNCPAGSRDITIESIQYIACVR